MRTVKKMTGIKIDHFMMADFNAVKTLTTAVGGVEVCLAKDIDDPDSHLKLSKGKHTIEGEQALAFVRTRHASASAATSTGSSPAAVPRLADAQDEVRRHPDQPDQAVRPRGGGAPRRSPSTPASATSTS